MSDTDTSLEVSCDLPDDLAVCEAEIDLLVACLSDLVPEIVNDCE